MFSISEEQLTEFGSKQLDAYHKQLADHCVECFPVLTSRLSADELHESVVRATNAARKLRFETDGGIRLVVELSLMFGCGFANDPLHHWAALALDVPDHAGEPRRARKLHDASNEYLADLLGNSMRSPVGLTRALRIFLERDNFEIESEMWAADVETLIARSFPEHVEAAMPDVCKVLVADVAKRAEGLGLKRHADAAHCVALQIAFGHRWFDDPAIPFLRRALDEGGMLAARKSALQHLPPVAA